MNRKRLTNLQTVRERHILHIYRTNDGKKYHIDRLEDWEPRWDYRGYYYRLKRKGFIK